MKAVLALVLASVALAAQSPSYGLQFGYGPTRSAGLDLASSSGTLAVDSARQPGFTLRGLAAWTLSPDWSLEASLGWRARSSGSLAYRSSVAGSGTLDVKQVLSSQVILGGLALRDLLVRTGTWSFGAGLDVRAERLSAETARAASAASLTRPWLRATARFAWSGAWRPWVALEFAAPVNKPATSAADYIQDLDRLEATPNPSAGSVAKAHAPTSEFLLAFGLRFPR